MRYFLFTLYWLAFPIAYGAEPVQVQLPSFYCTGMPLSITLPEHLTQLRKLARLQKYEVVRTEEWGDYKAIEIALHFEGLSVGVVTFTNDTERYTLSAARITAPKWSLSPFLVGQPAQPHLRHLGVTGQVSSGSWRFAGESDSLILKVKGGQIAEVIYECYTG
jgi:hypothetical protein